MYYFIIFIIFFNFSSKKISVISHTNTNLYYLLMEGNMVIYLLHLLKHFLIYHINQITHKLSQILLQNSPTITSKSFKKNNTQFTLKFTHIHLLPLSQVHLVKWTKP